MDPDIDFVTLLGPAGSGKTLLALAAGLAQTLERNRFVEIIMTRVTVPLGEDIGFLPGTEEEKMEPWMGALMDNLEVLTRSEEGGNWGRAATNDLLRNRIKIRSLNFMRGRTFLNRFIILDEAQNLTPKQMKALVTRAGPGSKLVCLGNIAQIDTPYLTETTCGLTYVVNRFQRLAAFRPHHAGAWRALAARGFRLRGAVGSVAARHRAAPARLIAYARQCPGIEPLPVSRTGLPRSRDIMRRSLCAVRLPADPDSLDGLRAAMLRQPLLRRPAERPARAALSARRCHRKPRPTPARPTRSDDGASLALLSSSLPDLGGPAYALISKADEAQIGRMAMAEMRDQNMILEDPEVTDYIQQLGMRLASQAHDEHQNFTYSVICASR